MLSILKDYVFSEQGLVDHRQPLITVTIPGLDGTWGFFAPQIEPWIMLAVAVLIQSFIQCIFAVVIYSTILPTRGTIEAYLVGWGVIIPLAMYIPFWLMNLLELQNRVVNLGMSTVMSVVSFRCLEAMYGTSPPLVEHSLSNYVAYYSTIIPCIWDHKTQSRARISSSKLVSNVLEVGVAFSGASLVLSFLKHYNFRPFSSSVHYESLEWTWELLSPHHFGNAYFHALLVYGTLKTGFELSAVNENIKGIDTYRLFDEPFTKSRTPTEFWTKRWNLLTQPALKRAFFLPMRKYFNPKIALLGTFIGSGLYHDYVWYCVFFDLKDAQGNCRSTLVPCYDHHFGRVTLFFTYIGFVMLLERPACKWAPVQWMSKNLPTFWIAHLLLLIHLPIGYWYYGDWIEGGYFDQFAVAVCQIKKI